MLEHARWHLYADGAWVLLASDDVEAAFQQGLPKTDVRAGSCEWSVLRATVRNC